MREPKRLAEINLTLIKLIANSIYYLGLEEHPRWESDVEVSVLLTQLSLDLKL